MSRMMHQVQICDYLHLVHRLNSFTCKYYLSLYCLKVYVHSFKLDHSFCSTLAGCTHCKNFPAELHPSIASLVKCLASILFTRRSFELVQHAFMHLIIDFSTSFNAVSYLFAKVLTTFGRLREINYLIGLVGHERLVIHLIISLMVL